MLKKTLEDIDRFERVFHEKDDEIEGEIKIITTPYVGAEWLLPQIKEFLKQYPKVTPIISLNNDEISNIDDFDIAICGFIHNKPQLIQKQLFTLTVRLFASPDYLKEFGTPTTPKDLDHHRIIFNEEKYMPYGNWILNLGHGADEAPRKPYIKIYSLPAMLKAATLGLGIVESPNLSSVFNLGLKEILPDFAGPQLPYYFIFDKDRQSSKRIGALLQFLNDKNM